MKMNFVKLFIIEDMLCASCVPFGCCSCICTLDDDDDDPSVLGWVLGTKFICCFLSVFSSILLLELKFHLANLC